MKSLQSITKSGVLLGALALSTACSNQNDLKIEVYETSAQGKSLERVEEFATEGSAVNIGLQPEESFQEITGFGGSFTESSAYLLNQLGPENRAKVIEAYFGKEGARYSLTRTHMNSCDFSLSNYSYAPLEGDKELTSFSIDEDRPDIIPFIKEAQAASQDGFRILSSPWTAPPWMKDNNSYVGGKLLPEYYDSWAMFFSKYIEAYKEEGIDIWGVTVENEPLGNDSNWDSMHYTPDEMTQFVMNHLGPQLDESGHGQVKILGYDQNREHLKEWVDSMYANEETSKYFDGTAIHWYASTYEVFPEELQYAHEKAPTKHMIQSEACIDGQVPVWKDDSWYWSKEAMDWGWNWAPQEQKYLHPKYVPVYRYARDIIGCLNNYVDGWVDWNMVLDRQGGPNWFKNWCGAPILVDPEADEVYLTPLYYTMAHFSKYIRPGAKRIGWTCDDESLLVTAAKNPDGSIALVVLNQGEEVKNISLALGEATANFSIDGKALQTIMIAE